MFSFTSPQENDTQKLKCTVTFNQIAMVCDKQIVFQEFFFLHFFVALKILLGRLLHVSKKMFSGEILLDGECLIGVLGVFKEMLMGLELSRSSIIEVHQNI